MKRYSIILLISLFTALHAAAQLYPVRTITNVGAPYPLSLEQYGSFDNSRLQLTIIPNDIALQNYPVKLRLVISGGWFKIYTNPSFIHKEILLNNGETMTFTGADLAEWFNPDNLIFEGYSKAQYMKTGRLPEGVYQIWFEAWDLYRDFNISGTTKAMVFTLENEPPILNFPENKKELEPYDPQNIVFNWSFRQSPFSASGSSHQYRFELWEIDPDDMNAEEAVRVMRPIYTTEVNATTLNYTAAEPLLFKGKRYAWRIQVFDPMGTMRYKNDGYSQVFWFRFGKDIPVPVLSLDKTTTSSITVKWENDYRVTKYELRYRNKAKEGANWYTKDATGQSATIDNLEQNTPYEIQLHGYNGSQEGDYSESVTAKTNQDKAFACGAAPGATNTENTDPLSMLKSGDIFRASDFDIEVYRTSGANGTFTGRGFAMIPYLKFVKFEVEFNGIQINKDYRMTRGQVRFIYNENNGLVVNISKIIDDLKSHEPRVVEDNPYKKAADQKIVSNADITEVTVDENGVVTAKTSDGRTTQVRGSASGDMVAVSGGSDDSEQYVADTKNKTVYKGTPEKATSGKKPEQPASKTSGPTQYEVTFLPHILEQGGMDIPTNNSPAANYHQIQVGSKTIQVPWKSVETNKIDRIVAHIAGDPADTVRFLTKEGNLVLSAPGDKAFVSKSLQNTPSAGTFKQLLVTGREKEDLLKAWYPEYEQVNDTTKKQTRILAGQVNIAAYDKITLDVCIVEVNGATVPETLPIEKELNEIYASSVVQWKVSRIKDFKVNIEGMQNGIFDNTDPNNDMDYTDHEKQVKEALKDHRDYNRKTLYLFFIGGKTKDNMLKGYMPFNKQFGFIFRDNQQIQELIRTMAHELGHGAFRLRHPFSPKCPYPQTKGQTNNLMDYVDAGKALQALALHKYQWDEVHDFDLGLNWFEDEEEGEYRGCLRTFEVFFSNTKNYELSNPIKDKYYSFITPAGVPITLPHNVTQLKFGESFVSIPIPMASSTINSCSAATITINNIPKEVLTSFTLNNEVYSGVINERDITQPKMPYTTEYAFTGYKGKTTGFYADPISASQKEFILNYINSKGLLENKACLLEVKKEENEKYYGAGKLDYGPNIPCIFKTEITKDLLNADVEKFAQKLKVLISNSGKYLDTDFPNFDKNILRDLNDRFVTYSNKTNKKIFVICAEISYYLDENGRKDFVNKIIDKVNQSSPLFSSSNMIFVCLPYYMKQSGQTSAIEYNLMSLYGYYATKLSIPKEKDFVVKSIIDIYKQLPKPYYLLSYYLSYKGELLEFIPKNTQSCTGKEHIYDFRILIDSRLEEYLELLKGAWDRISLINALNPNGNLSGGLSGLASANYRKELNDYIQKIESFPLQHSFQNALPIDHGLYESYISQFNNLNYSNIAQQYAKWFRCHKFNEVKSLAEKLKISISDENSPESKYFISGKNEVVYLENLEKINKVGLVLSFLELDIATDIFGALYTGYYHDWANTAQYTVGAAIPFSVILFKTGKVTKTAIQGVIEGSEKLTKEGEVYRIVDNIAEGLTKTGSKLTDNLTGPIKTTYNELKTTLKVVDDGNIIKFLNKQDKVLAEIVEENGENVLRVADDGMLDEALSTSTKIDIDAGVKILDEDGNVLTDIQLVKNSDGSVGFYDKSIGSTVTSNGKQILNKKPSSRVLAKNLEATGTPRPANTAAHHIVPGNETYSSAVQVRQILARENIDINEAINGVFLPKNNNFAKPPATTHTNVHTNKYYDNLLDRLTNAQPGKVRNELKKIQNELLNGTFPYN